MKREDAIKLDIELKNLVVQERAASARVIDHMLTMFATEAHIALGWDSLFTYLVKDVGYSETAAYHKLRVMELLRKVPEVQSMPGHSMSGLEIVGKLTRDSSPRETLKVLEATAGLSVREVEGKTREILNLPPPKRKIVIEAAQENHALWKEVQDKLVHLSQEEILALLCREFLEKDTNKKKSEVSRQSPDARFFGAVLNRQAKERSACCEFVSEITGKKCGSTYGLQIDHRVPFCKGGKTTLSNARVLCPAHNRFLGGRGGR